MICASGSKLRRAKEVRACRRPKNEERGLSQDGLGYKTGLHRNYVDGVERGECNLTPVNVIKLGQGPRLRTLAVRGAQRGDVEAPEIIGEENAIRWWASGA
jgi:hypothetical protein